MIILHRDALTETPRPCGEELVKAAADSCRRSRAAIRSAEQALKRCSELIARADEVLLQVPTIHEAQPAFALGTDEPTFCLQHESSASPGHTRAQRALHQELAIQRKPLPKCGLGCAPKTLPSAAATALASPS